MSEALTTMIVDGGARGHVLSVAHEKSPDVKRIILAPGNDYAAHNRHKEVVAVACDLNNPLSIVEIADRYQPDLIEVAQDDAIAAGAVDHLQVEGYRVFGPTRAAGQIEWDKSWSRGFMERHGLPSPTNVTFSDPDEAKRVMTAVVGPDGELRGRYYVKAAGLAAGKGALPADSLEELHERIDQMAGFGTAGERFVIEKAYEGEEFSYYALSDGISYRTFKSAQDNKRVLENDRGPNTGGMGATAPALVTTEREQEIEEDLIKPALDGLAEEGRPFQGVLYLGGILQSYGEYGIIEYNARWGDPEVQAVLPGLETDYVELIRAASEGRLDSVEYEEDSLTRVCIVGAAKGYPGDYSAVTGMEISGLAAASGLPNVEIYGAAVKVTEDGRFLAEGGRLFSVVGAGRDVVEARETALDAIQYISIEGGGLHYRRDIGKRDVRRIA